MPTLLAGNRTNSRTAAAGVTLIEMMVVVAIIAIVTALAAPSMSAGLDSVRMASATDNVATFLNSAVNRAERRQQPVAVVISIKENRLVMYSTEAGFTREMSMPDGIAIEGVLPIDPYGPPPEDYRLMLMPGASVPGLGVQLINQHRNRRVVWLDPMTGFPRVETPKAGQ
jgi:prepilin-type N-terminal cleavage/methylation domain-containing protein